MPPTDTALATAQPARVLVTGGAGFVGSNLALAIKRQWPSCEVVAFDNLRRRGSELNVPRLQEAEVRFHHGDVRNASDLMEVGYVDAIVECSAEPSVLAGVENGPASARFLVDTNLFGAINCVEFARTNHATVIFISTSRVYPYTLLADLNYQESPTRFVLSDEQPYPGASARGIDETFPLDGARTLYGATKLAAEHLVAEYSAMYGLEAVINRCGVVAGPWQFGRVDQGFLTYWLLAHYFGAPLKYLGFGGSGKQVRDVLHVDDLADLVLDQLARPSFWSGRIVNVGGGLRSSVSLCELTEICRELTGNSVEIVASEQERPGDIPIYISNCARLEALASWQPRHTPRSIAASILEWIEENERELCRMFLANGVLSGQRLECAR